MTNVVLLSDNVTASGSLMTLGFGVNAAFIGSKATVGTSDTAGSGLVAAAINQKITVAGTLIGGNAILFENLGRLSVVAGGLATGFIRAVEFQEGGYVANDGTLEGFTGIFARDLITVVNAGTIQATSTAIETLGDLTLTNSGTINSLDRGLRVVGAATILNTGSITGSVETGDLADTITNTGTITGLLLAGGGADLIDNATGRLLDRVSLEAGDDVFLGGAYAETVDGGTGRDEITLEAGDDRFLARNEDGADDIDGGAGIDLYDGSASSQAVVVNLTTGQARVGSFSDDIAGFERVQGGSGRDSLTGDIQNNVLRGGDGLDTLLGNAGQDRLYGDAGNDSVAGGDGNDRLWGGEGRDTLNGGAGDDVLTGGNDVDVLTGGSGADRFVWTDTQEFVSSGLTGIERITDFQQGQDKIDLSQIDAVPGGADDAYSFVAVWNDFNEVAVRTTATQTFVVINATDFIRLDAVIALTAADFIL